MIVFIILRGHKHEKFLYVYYREGTCSCTVYSTMDEMTEQGVFKILYEWGIQPTCSQGLIFVHVFCCCFSSGHSGPKFWEFDRRTLK